MKKLKDFDLQWEFGPCIGTYGKYKISVPHDIGGFKTNVPKICTGAGSCPFQDISSHGFSHFLLKS